MSKTVLSSLLALALLAGASTAEAGTKKVRLDYNELNPDGIISGTLMGMYTIMGDAGLTFVTVPWVLPSDFKTNSTIKMKVHLATAEIACNVFGGVVAVMRARPGKITSALGIGDAGHGITNATGLVYAVSPTAEKLFAHSSTLAKPTAGTITSQKAGDMLSVMFAREGTNVADTCTDALLVSGVTFTYETN
jgi:hypothetical protein